MVRSREPGRVPGSDRVREGLPWAGRPERSAYSWLVLGLAIVWGIGDVLSTLFALQMLGTPALEANPLVRNLLAREPLVFPILKAAVVLVATVALLRWNRLVQQVPGSRGWLVGLTGVGLLLTVNNLFIGASAIL